MNNSIKIFAAAAMFTSVALGGAFAAPGDGEYYQGASRTPIMEGSGMGAGGASVQEIIPGGESAYYEGLSRQPETDLMSTGSISSSTPEPLTRGDGDYYTGASSSM